MEALTVTIPSGTAITGEIDLKGRIPCGIIMPAAWTAAALTFQAAAGSGGTYVDMYDGGAEKSETVGASQYIVLDPTKFLGVPFLKVRSGTTGTPVNQGADRSLVLMVSEPAA